MKGCLNNYKNISAEDEDSSSPLLHGVLRVHVIEAKDLPDTDNSFFNISRGDLTDPYLELELGHTSLLKTSVIKNCLDPHWNEKFSVPVCHNAKFLVIKVKDREHIGANTVGHFKIPTEIIRTGDIITGWYDLIVGSDGETHGNVHIWIQYADIGQSKPEKFIYNSYFAPEFNNQVTLYQDADTPALKCFEGVSNPDGTQYIPTRCWKDIYETINQAEKLIYMTGWSIFTSVQLLRGEEHDDDSSTIGELLKRKSKEGVRVLILTWNEKEIFNGLMGTHDEDTVEYFQGTEVICSNVPREKESWLGLGGTFVSTCYTHHQKTIIADTAGEGGKRRLIAYIGGLDITDGRYDTPEFPLFKTLLTNHAGDFYSKCMPGAKMSIGPRQPWHDIHARVEGPAALDICQNFIDRWKKQSKSQEAYLVPLDDDFDLISPGPSTPEQGGPWVAQIFRSITSDSTEFSPSKTIHLHRKYGRYVDNSIENGYVSIIRNAEKFIYIENQYFLGSAFSWYRDRSTQSQHLIPIELTQKIVSKIKAGEEFKVYVCIPMYPEGDPSSDASQEILYWQYCTMESMYKKIAKALATQKKSTKLPTDYLNFYCLGKRESMEEVPSYLDPPPPNTPAERLRKTLRHPIYVHSKLMIADDDYIIVGSANINQRSLGGNRDTEICIGAFQPEHTVESGSTRGGVHTFRTALWSAHLGGFNKEILDPSTDTCLNYVRRVTENYNKVYNKDSPEHSDVHLLPYPIKILQNGKVKCRNYKSNFPDTTAPILGRKSGYLPEKLTT